MNIIIGKRSLLSQSKKFDEKKFLKLNKEDISDIELIKKLRNKKLNIIINLFYPSKKLNDNINVFEFVDQSFYKVFNSFFIPFLTYPSFLLLCISLSKYCFLCFF